MQTLRLWDVIVVGAYIVAACAPAPASPAAMMEATPMQGSMESSQTPMADAMMEPATPAADAMPAGEPTSTLAAMQGGETPMSALPEWMGVSLSNVVTGQQFLFSDFPGKVVLVEPMAVWCTKCRALQQEIRNVREELGGQASDLIVVSIDVDPNEDEQYLKAYVDQTGHDWAFAVAPADLSRALAAAYGDQFLNPPSTPLLLIDRDGVPQLLPFGPKSSIDVLNALHPMLNAGM